MSIKVNRGSSEIDGRVASLLERIAHDGPLKSMKSYTIERRQGDFTFVTVTVIADAEFDPDSPS